jgi:serine/threonine-protein kinase
MHKKSLVHRDLKPENIFLAEREDGPPRVKLLDFGVAKVVAEGATAAGATEAVGTPSYMAPEQFRNGPRITPATDVYAFGLTAYTLLVGTPYWYDETTSGNAFAVAMAAAHGPSEPASVRAARREVALPPAFDAWFSTATAVDPAQRYVSAGAAVRALAPIFGLGVPLTSTMEGPRVDPSVAAPVSAPVPTVGLPSYSSTVRYPRSRSALLAVAMLVLGGGIAVAFVTSFSGGSPPAGGASSSASAPPSPAAAGGASSAVATGPPLPAASSSAAVVASAVVTSAASARPAVSAGSSSKTSGPTKSGPRSWPTPVYSQE